MPKPNPLYVLGNAGAAEGAATGRRTLRWILEALAVYRAWSAHASRFELSLVIVTIVVFEALVAGANLRDSRLEPGDRSAWRVRVTRALVVGAGIALGIAAWLADDAMLLFVAVFVAIAGFIASSYVPDALFGGTTLVVPEDASEGP